MPFDWNDLSAPEKKLAEDVAAGLVYDGGWEFRISSDRDVLAAAGLDGAAEKRALEALGKIQFWRARLAEEQSAERDEKRSTWARLAGTGNDRASDEARQEVAAIQESLQAKFAEFEEAIVSIKPPTADFWHDRLVEEVEERNQLSARPAGAERDREIEEADAEIERIRNRLRGFDYVEFGQLRDKWRKERGSEQLDSPELAGIEERIAELLDKVVDKLDDEELQRSNARNRYGEFAARRVGKEGSLQFSAWIPATEAGDAIRPALIRALYLAFVRDASGKAITVPASGIRIKQARLAGPGEINLKEIAGSSALPPLVLEGCFITSQPTLDHCRIQQVSFRRSVLPGFNAHGLRCDGEVMLDHVQLIGDAKLNFSNARIAGAFAASFLSSSKEDGNPEIDLSYAVVDGQLTSQRSLGEATNVPKRRRVQRLTVKADSSKFGSEVDFFNTPLKGFSFFLAESASQVSLWRCDCEEAVNFRYSVIGGYADFGWMRALESLDLTGAKIDGDLFLWGSVIQGKGKAPGFFARLAKIGGNIEGFFVDEAFSSGHSFQCNALASLDNAEIAGNVNFHGASIGSGSGVAIDGQALSVGGNLNLGAAYGGSGLQPFKANGRISIMRADIKGALSMQGAIVTPAANDPEDAVSFSMATIGTGVFLRAENTEQGPHIPVDGLKSNGCVNFVGAEIGTGFDAEGADLRGSGTGRRGYIALDLRYVNVKGPVWLGQARRCGLDGPRLKSEGTVTLQGAVISGSVEVNNAGLKELVPENNEEAAISTIPVAAFDAEQAQIGGHLRLGRRQDAKGKETTVSGRVILDRIKIGGDLKLTGGSFCHREKNENIEALSLRSAKVEGSLEIEDKEGSYPKRNGIFDLTGASFAAINDDGGGGWGPAPAPAMRPQGSKNEDRIILRLDGCLYDRFEKASSDILASQMRKDWLNRQYKHPNDPKRSEYSPRSYEQVIRVFQQGGDHDHARSIAIEYGRKRRQCALNNWFSKRLNWLYDFTARYGYSPARVTGVLFAYFLIGWLAAFALVDYGWIGPKRDRMDSAQQIDADCSIFCRGAIALPYALDAMLPALRMGAQIEWDIALPSNREGIQLSGVTISPKVAYPLLRFLKLLYAALGTSLMALAVLTWTGVLRRGRNS
jgi:hypothetical protein